MKRVGPIETERAQMIDAIRNGATFEEATAPFRATVEQDWFDRNEQHLVEVATGGEQGQPPAPAKPSKGSKK